MKIAGVVLLRLAIMVGLVVTYFGAAAQVVANAKRTHDQDCEPIPHRSGG